MHIDGAVTYLVCTILFSCGTVCLAGLLVLLNNLFHRYWKRVNLATYSFEPKETLNGSKNR